ncbi:sugar phosphate isomerase/epimerase and 4-hydroxyphenylpyruvate domain-containing protein [Parahaliea maris]|uniref:3-dehydroshikimate dehydratase n=1 Tax=Parahaliea maris TaxID=2716870 RepID=A0A5C8ZSA7_9GAMM|nr:sugar phosphate isomerase/epimerase and 4-hydroxyphenylpyruvate domain-containing protein [Parahaliea maris]TXS90241.1 sugar phosphate isomerase/epimerase and 4-hydroxyphenylpyruvate domain-containing protein [Parahaliea maris]
MKRSIATVCLSGDLRQKIQAAGQAGYDGIEIFENDLMLFNESPSVVRQMAQDSGLEIIALQPFRDFECMPATKMQKNFDRAERKFDLMEELGTDTLLICSNVSPQCVDNFELAVDQFGELADRAGRRTFKLGYEALAWGRHIRDYQQAWKLVRHVDADNLGVVLDSFHIFARGRDLSTLREIPGDRIALIQIADAPWLKMDVLQWSRHFRCFPGQGDFPVVEFMESVLETGYNGYISHEIFNDEFRSSPCKRTAVDGMRSLLWLEEEVARSVPDLVDTEAEAVSHLPPKASVRDFEFVEFAAHGDDNATLVNLITSLGFRKTHHHRSKDVDLYRQGDACIVINEEPDSFAQNHYLVHGLSVCAVAYRSDDADGMAERASWLGYRSFEGNVESGELDIPGIRGLGDELAYFVQRDDTGQRFYDVDFQPIESPALPPSAPGTNMRIDHITSGISESEFLSISLFYRALFGLDIAQPQDLIDPYGIVVSRTATSKDHRIRLPFNMSRSWGASTERFREQHKGSGVQHIALACDDIVAFVKRLDPSIQLPIPQNYYDDLEARYDLEPDLLDALRTHNLLYDQCETGFLIHFYTRAFNGLFFEVLQRTRYGNYGENNAHVRMAAQARLRMIEPSV